MRIFRTLTFTLAILMNLASHAQDSRSVNLSAGLLYPNTLDATLSYEIETKYHNAWEFFANGAAKWKDCPSCGHNRSGKIIRHGESAWPTSLVCCATAMLSDE